MKICLDRCLKRKTHTHNVSWLTLLVLANSVTPLPITTIHSKTEFIEYKEILNVVKVFKEPRNHEFHFSIGKLLGTFYNFFHPPQENK